VIERVLPNPGPNNPTNNMNSPEGAVSVAKELIDAGADIIFIHAAAANVGAIKLAQERGIHILNYGKDLTTLAPKTVVANGLQVIPVMMAKMTEVYTAGSFEGKNYVMGLTDGAVKLSPLSDELVPVDVQERINQVEQDLISEKIKLEIQR
jgi:basic membrane protein A and related proteins